MVCATVLVEYFSHKGLPSFGYIDIASTLLLPILTFMASHINFLEDANAKSLTFCALNFQVFFVSNLCFSLSTASSCVDMSTGWT